MRKQIPEKPTNRTEAYLNYIVELLEAIANKEAEKDQEGGAQDEEKN